MTVKLNLIKFPKDRKPPADEPRTGYFLLCKFGLHRWGTWTLVREVHLWRDGSDSKYPIGFEHQYRRICETCGAPEFKKLRT